MYLGIGALFLIAFAWWLIWSKLCDIEKKQFRMHDEISLSLQQIEKDLAILQDAVYRIENKDKIY